MLQISSNRKPFAGSTTVPIKQAGKPLELDGPLDGTPFHLESHGTLEKQSYIQMDHVYEIPFSMLRPLSQRYWANRLTEKCYQEVLRRFNLVPDSWVTTALLERGGWRNHPSIVGCHPSPPSNSFADLQWRRLPGHILSTDWRKKSP